MERVDVIELRAPAKINLSFRILGRREDGFHEIETLMAPVSVFDRLTIERADALSFSCDDPSLPSGDDNLVVRAAKLFIDATNAAPAAHIHLEKRIPHGAGLGGGSSDAAATLLGLNRLFDANLPREALAQLGAEIGSDVPFFIFESAAQCAGRGELVAPTALGEKFRLLLLKPAFGVPTPWAYSRWKDARELPGTSYAAQEFAGLTFVNDLERPVFEKHLVLAEMKMWLLEQSEVGAALLSGSGSTVFAALRDGADAAVLAARATSELDPELWMCACETL
jgi:4-diphosphocytidyl-2-C-methyl-D-erythritol kinase